MLRSLALAALASTQFLFGNDVLYDEPLAGPYRLVAVDTMESMAIVWQIPDRGGLVGDGLPGPTVFAAGHDDRYLVAAVHPPLCPPFSTRCTDFRMNRRVTQYWYVIRQPDESRSLPYRGIRGPFTAERFERERGRLGLPPFSIRFRDLE